MLFSKIVHEACFFSHASAYILSTVRCAPAAARAFLTHTSGSLGHAFSQLEYASATSSRQAAAGHPLQLMSPSQPDSGNPWHFANVTQLARHRSAGATEPL